MTAVASVKLDDPEFHGAIRDVLGGATVRACVEQALRDHIGRWLEGHPERAAAVIDPTIQATAGTDQQQTALPVPSNPGQQGGRQHTALNKGPETVQWVKSIDIATFRGR